MQNANAANGFSRYMTLENDTDKIFRKNFNFYGMLKSILLYNVSRNFGKIFSSII